MQRLAALGEAIERELSPHQREVLVALALNDVPIDVLAERLNTTRGALYKTLHDARHKLRAALAARGLSLDDGAECQHDRHPPSATATVCSRASPAHPDRSSSCEECFEELDRYVELELAGSDADTAIPGMQAHLAGCSACAEDHDSLRALLLGEASSNA